MNFLSTLHRRIILFTLQYASEGAPIGFLWWAPPTELRSNGIPIEKITTLTSLLALPWAFKFLWVPFIDTMQSTRWKLRSWILASQTVIGVMLLSLLFIDGLTHFTLLMPLHNFALSATTKRGITPISDH